MAAILKYVILKNVMSKQYDCYFCKYLRLFIYSCTVDKSIFVVVINFAHTYRGSVG